MNEDLSPTPSDILVRRLSRRYLLVLAAVAGLIGIDQALIQPMLVRMDGFAPVINLAGRQRMLSQRIVKAALAIQADDDEPAAHTRHEELRTALAEWTAAHTALRQGDAALGVLRVHTPDTDEQWKRLQPQFEAMHSAATGLLKAPDSSNLSTRAAAMEVLLDNEPAFLVTMERLVSQIEGEAARELARLRLWALCVGAAIIGLLAALGRFVVRPALQAIRGRIDDLEQHVALRTRELDATLTSLRHEIAERERSDARSKTLASQLAHADRVESMNRLAMGLAHEVNQPLGAIANYAQACSVVLSRPFEEADRLRLREFTDQIEQAALRAGGIVRRMRNFVRPGLGNVASVELQRLVREVLELWSFEARQAELEVLFEPCASEIVVTADPIQIQQVLLNLLQNAKQAVEQVPPQRRRVTVRIVAAHDAVQVDVLDSGPGLCEVDPETLFAPFCTTKSDGLGVGLSICRSIVEQHRGTIWARSLSGYGAQFSFVLPLTHPHDVQPNSNSDRICR